MILIYVECDCDLSGSYNNSCDSITGQCPCKPNVVGRTCNKCALNYYGIASTSGCMPCACSILYSTSSACDQNGSCKCKPGVSSAKCTQCDNGYYDLSITGKSLSNMHGLLFCLSSRSQFRLRFEHSTARPQFLQLFLFKIYCIAGGFKVNKQMYRKFILATLIFLSST